jgi:hypothetical protein
MFVSSYSTYIDTNRLQKSQETQKEERKTDSSAFSKQLKFNPTALQKSTGNIPINYISDYKVLNNQQKLQQDTEQNMQKLKFSKIKAFDSAKTAYTDNTKIFSLLVKPSATLDQTPKVDKKMPPKAQEAKEAIMKHQMVNTYLANENYYRITA